MVLGVGNKNAKIFGLGEAPGVEEEKYGQPFIGKAGKLLTYTCKHVRLDREQDMFIDNVIKTLPANYGGESNQPTEHEIERDRPLLLNTLNEIKPKYIVCFGAIAIGWFKRELVFVSDCVGKPFSVEWLNFPHLIIPTWHPSGILRSEGFENYGEFLGNLAYTSFCAKEKLEEFNSKINWKIPKEEELDIIFDKINKSIMIGIDVEVARSGQNIGIGIATSAYEAYYFPLRTLPMFGYELLPYYNNQEKVLNFFYGLISSNIPKILQNAKYDMHQLENEFKTVINRVEYDSMEMARLVYNNFMRRGLDYLVRYLRPPQAGWKAEIKEGTKEVGMEEIPLETIAEYCCKDVANTFFLIEIMRYLL